MIYIGWGMHLFSLEQSLTEDHFLNDILFPNNPFKETYDSKRLHLREYDFAAG